MKKKIVYMLGFMTMITWGGLWDVSMGCGTIDSNMTITLPCVAVDGYFYKVQLANYKNPNDPDGLYWKLDDVVPGTDDGACATLDDALNLVIPCLNGNNTQIHLPLNYYDNTDNVGFYWGLPSTLTASKTYVNLNPGDTETISITGGTGNYSAVSSSSSAGIQWPGTDGSLKITAFSAGDAEIEVVDLTTQFAVYIDIEVTPKTCGAYVAPGVWKEFDCYNLGAAGNTTGDDAFTPSWALIGGYWKWGRTDPIVSSPTGPSGSEANAGPISDWEMNYADDGAWSDNQKTANDPCPDGFRVPTKTQWDGVIDNNTTSVVGTWVDDSTNYSSARFFGNNLMLPAAGRYGEYSGVLYVRGYNGYYWSSTEDENYYAGHLEFSQGATDTKDDYRSHAYSVRCIAE